MSARTSAFSAVLVGLSLAVAGCLSTHEPVSQRVFRLSGCQAPAEPAGDDAAASGARRGPVIRVNAVRAPDWLQDTAIVYRLDYAAGASRSSYSRARWAEPPTAMLTTDVRASLAEQGPWRAVVGPDTEARTDWTLTVRIDELVHGFTSAQQSYASLRGSLLLVDSAGNILAQREIRHRVAADGTDVVAGVAALSKVETGLCGDAARLLRQVYRSRQKQPADQRPTGGY